MGVGDGGPSRLRGGRRRLRRAPGVSKAANDDVAIYRRQGAEYREYIETWVHEAKSPLAAAHLMLENIEDELQALDGNPVDAETLLDRMGSFGDELDRMEGYVEQALFFARSETLDRDYLIREYGLCDLVSAAIRANSHVLISSRVSPTRGDLDYRVFTDEKWMQFILGQIIQNSVKYARPEGAAIEFSAALRDEGLERARGARDSRQRLRRERGGPAARLREGFHGGWLQRKARDGYRPVPRRAAVQQDGHRYPGGLRRGLRLHRDALVPDQPVPLLRVGGRPCARR